MYLNDCHSSPPVISSLSPYSSGQRVFLFIFRFYTQVSLSWTGVPRTGTLVTPQEPVLELNPLSLGHAALHSLRGHEPCCFSE